MYYFDIDEIITFSICPMQHYFKYILKDDSFNLVMKYNNDMMDIVYRLFEMMDSNYISIANLKKIWGKRWINKKVKGNFIYHTTKSWRDSFSTYQKRGIESIVYLYETYSKSSIRPIIVNSPYTLKISNTVGIKGKFHVISEQDEMIEIMMFRNFKILDRFYTQNDIEATMNSLAFRTKFKQQENNISINCFERKKKQIQFKTKKDYEMAINDIINIIKSIKNNIYYHSVGEKCFYCPYKRICSETKKTDNELIVNHLKSKKSVS